MDGHRPKLVISAGFAGGLDARLHRGDIVWVDGLVDEAGGQYETERRRLPAALAEAKDCFVGRLLTVDRIIRLPDEKLALGRQYAALACDMESIAVAEVCHRREVPFLAVRVINDAVDDLLPRSVERLLAQKTGAARLAPAVGSILKASFEPEGPAGAAVSRDGGRRAAGNRRWRRS